MSVRFYITRDDRYEKGFEHTFEREAALQVAKQLWKKFQFSAGTNHYALIANPQDPHADLIILTTNGLGILDLKNFGGKIVGQDDKEWYLLNEHGKQSAQVKGGSHLNPFVQVRSYKRKVFRNLKVLAKKHPKQLPAWMNDPTVKYYVQGAVVFTSGQIDTSELDLNPKATEPWFQILQPHEISNWTYSLVFGADRNRDLRLTPEQIDFIARTAFGVEEWTEVQDFLDGSDPFAYLWRKQGKKRISQYLLTEDETSIGRSPDNGIYLASELFAQVSRHHAIIRRIGNEVRIYDQNSRHGTWVNGTRVMLSEGVLIQDGDEIVLGALNEKQQSEGVCQFEYRRAVTEINKTASVGALLQADQTGTISLDQLSSALSQSYAEGYKRKHGIYPGQYIRVNVDPKRGRMLTYVGYLVVEEVQDPEREILLAEALKVNPNATVGEIELIPSDWSPTEDDWQTVLNEASQTYLLQQPFDGNPDAFMSSMLGGRLLDGKYYLQDDFKSGGFGHVYRANQRNMNNRLVAIKVLKRGRVAQELYKEAQQSAAIEHPNIVRLYDINTTTDGITYLVMEWVDGLTLLQWRTEALSYEANLLNLVQIARDICEGLAYIHDNDVVHGDISPKNVLLTQHNGIWHPKLTDFGLAWALSEGKPEHRGGTPLYIAPEVFEGKPDHRADIYSLGAVLFYLFTGTHHLGDLDVLKKQPLENLRERIFKQKPLHISDLQNGVFNPFLDELIFQMLSVNPAERPETVASIIETLDEVLNYSPAAQANAVEATVSYYVPPSSLAKMRERLESANAEWLNEKLKNIPAWYFEDPQSAPQVFETVFGKDEVYDVFLYNDGLGRNGYLQVKLIFALHTNNPANLRLIKALGSVPIFYAEISPERQNLFIFGLHLTSAEKAKNSYSNSVFANLNLTLERGHYPVGLWEHIKRLPRDPLPDPDTEERLKHWQGYLDVWERIAREKEYEVDYIAWRFDQSQDGVWFTLHGVDDKTWGKIRKTEGDQISLGELKGDSVERDISDTSGALAEDYDPFNRIRLGTVEKINSKRQRMLVKLDEYFLKTRWDQDKNLPIIASTGRLDYTATGDRYNIVQQREALNSLKIGQTANPRLNRFIFDAQEAAVPDAQAILPLDDTQLLSKNLNPDQRNAVESALAAPDLYLIQGPPGTGKTTVIAELCHQFTQRGQRVLVASQANLAVDNALARLRHSPQILALRMGNVTSIEDEGAEFIEDNVVRRWFENTLRDHTNSHDELDRQISDFQFIAANQSGLQRYVQKIETMQPIIAWLEEFNQEFEQKLTKIKHERQQTKSELKHFASVLQHVADAAQRWQDMPSINLLWRTQYFDFATVDNSFSLYLDAILDAKKILQQEAPQFLEEALYKQLSVLERDMLRQYSEGNKQAHTQVESPVPLFRFGSTLATQLHAVKQPSVEWTSLVERLHAARMSVKHIAHVQSLETMPERIESSKQIFNSVHELYKIEVQIGVIKDKYFEFEERIRTHEKQQVQITEQLAKEQRKLETLEEARHEITRLMIELDQSYHAAKGIEAEYDQSFDKNAHEDLEQRVRFGEALLASCEKVIAAPDSYILIRNEKAMVDVTNLHQQLQKVYSGQVLPVTDESLNLFTHTIKAMRQKIQQMGVVRINVDPKAVNTLKAQWWNKVLKPALEPCTPEGDMYVFVDPLQARKTIQHALNRTRTGAAEHEALNAIIGFFEAQADKRLHLLAAEELHQKMIEEVLPRWQEVHKKNLEEQEKLTALREERASRVSKEIGLHTGQFAKNAKHLRKYLDKLKPYIFIHDLNLDSMNVYAVWETSKSELERFLKTQLTPAIDEMINGINGFQAKCDAQLRKRQQIEKAINKLKEQFQPLDQQRQQDRKHLKHQLEGFYLQFKEKPDSLRLFDSISDLYQLQGSDAPLQDIRAAYEMVSQSYADFEEEVVAYQQEIGDKPFEEYLRGQRQQHEQILEQLWSGLKPFVDMAQLELQIAHLEQWETFILEQEELYTGVEVLIAYLQPKILLSNWYERVEREIGRLQKQVEKLVQQEQQFSAEKKRNETEIQRLKREMAEWDDLWANAFHSIPVHLRSYLPNRAEYQNHAEFVEAVAKVAESNNWQAESARLAQQSPAIKNLIADWKSRLLDPQVGDEQSILQLYLNNANVIGTSCGQVRRLDRNNQISSRFDIAIIDEVSKATPPELLMPMIRARKVILLGDHKQLPPMIGTDSTIREIAEELDLPQEQLSHLQEPLFKHLYNSAANDLKVMLRKQYRMPAVIRDAITGFYDGKLTGGHNRKHELEMPSLFGSETALAWIDTPRQDDYAEKMEGTSFRNDGEVTIISRLLNHMNRAWQQKLNIGTAKEPKEVGLITFYLPQYRALNQVARSEQFPALNLRVGTVDRFQGMERPVIIVSTVRNNDRGAIGFAKAPERINVAFSRAQELLVVVGCQQMFTHANGRNAIAVNARSAYQHIADLLQQPGGKRIRVTEYFNLS